MHVLVVIMELVEECGDVEEEPEDAEISDYETLLAGSVTACAVVAILFFIRARCFTKKYECCGVGVDFLLTAPSGVPSSVLGRNMRVHLDLLRWVRFFCVVVRPGSS